MVNSVIFSGGQMIRGELESMQAKYPTKKVLRTNSHSLPCSDILHLNISTNRQDVVATVVEAFMTAELLGATTVSVPCFGEFLRGFVTVYGLKQILSKSTYVWKL